MARADASVPFTCTMIGFAPARCFMGRLADRFSIMAAVICCALLLGAGYIGASFSPSLPVFAFASGVIGLGSSASFAPMMADISHWFTRRRGIAVAIVACGNYLAGTIWPP